MSSPAAIGHPMRSWLSSKGCDYADSLGAGVPCGRGAYADIGIIRISA